MTNKYNQKNGIWIMTGMVVAFFLVLWLSLALVNPALAELPLSESVVSIFIDAPDTVDVDLLIERGFIIEDNIAIAYYPVYNVWDSIVGMGRGMIYLELPDRRLDVNRDGAVNLFDCTYWIAVVYKGL